MDHSPLKKETPDGDREEDQSIPQISFIIATYNVALFIEEALLSVLAQQDVSFEIIVVDDASSDETPEIVAKMSKQDARIKLFRQSTNGGPSIARNIAISKARGEWVALFDGDDQITPERTRSLLDLARTTSATMVADNYERYLDGKPSGITMIQRGHYPYWLTVDIDFFYRANAMFKKQRDTLGAIKPMFKRSFLIENNIRFDEQVRIGEDFHFCLDCLLSGARFVVASDVHYHYRIHNASLSWRVDDNHVEKLLETHEKTEAKLARLKDEKASRAADYYVWHLKRGQSYIVLINLLKQRSWKRVVRHIVDKPRSLELLSQFVPEMVFRRLKPIWSGIGRAGK